MNKKLVTTLFCIAFLTGCASNTKHVPRHAGYKTLSFGKVMSKEKITIGGSQSGIGSYVGSAAAIHDATSRSFLGFIVRGLAGAVVGSTVEEVVTRTDGMLYTIEKSNGSFVEVSSRNTEFNSGACVQIAHAGHRQTEIKIADAVHCKSIT